MKKYFSQSGFTPIQIILSIFAGTIVLGGIVGGGLYYSKSPQKLTEQNTQQQQQGKCGDGICQDVEKARGVCGDCKISQEQKTDTGGGTAEEPRQTEEKPTQSQQPAQQQVTTQTRPVSQTTKGDNSLDADGFLWGTEATGESSATTNAIKNTLQTKYVKFRIFADSCSADLKTFSASCANPRLSNPKQNFNLDDTVDYYSQNSWSMVPMLSYSSDDRNSSIKNSDNVDSYVDFVYWFVKTYHKKANIKYLELMNVPNINKTLLLEAQNKVYDKIKGEFPDILIGTPGFEYWDDPINTENMIDEIEYFLDKNNGAKFDFWAFHGYASASVNMQKKEVVVFSPTMKPTSNKYSNVYGALEIKKALVANGWTDRPVIDLEHSMIIKPGETITSDNDKLAATYATQELLLKKTLTYNGKSALAGAMIFKVAERKSLGEFAYGALNPDGSLTKTIQAVGLLWSKLNVYNYNSKISGDFGKDDIWVEKFTSGADKELYIFFKPFEYKSGQSLAFDNKTINYTLNLSKTPKSVTLTDIDGKTSSVSASKSIALQATNSLKYLEISY